jgi:hypothetical protein
MKRIITIALFCLVYSGAFSQKMLTISKDKLHNKIKGGWAGQVIGVTFGGPYEFRFNGTFIQDYQPLLWYDGYLKKTMIEIPGLYDDLYMDLTFVDVFEKYGLNAPVDSFANAFAHARYVLWHANQAARYNILNGIPAPQSGNWKNNPHSEDIDYQIESDYAGLMSPGMPNAASGISDKIGHIMNYGDGYYGGVFIGAMYSFAFVSDDPHYIVEQALKTIPAKSEFYQCINDVIKWNKKYPADWHQAWFELQKKWSSDIACPDGIFHPFNIDSKINSAYVVLGLLYGRGDFGKTLEIATRAGQDADCNPSSAGGILGTILGYDKIPAYWKMGLKEAEDIDFKYTTISLNKVYDIGLKHALLNIQHNGGKVDGDKIVIATQSPAPVPFEKGFPDMYPIERRHFNNTDVKEMSFEFTGTGFVVMGEAENNRDVKENYVFEAELTVDGEKVETAKFPTDYTIRRLELFWKYELENKKHQVTIKVLNPDTNHKLQSTGLVIFSDKPVTAPLTESH